MAAADVVTDVTEQCRIMGDLHHAIAAGAMTSADVSAELCELVAGRKAVRCDASGIVVFDSTGTAVQDVASAAIVYERALALASSIASGAVQAHAAMKTAIDDGLSMSLADGLLLERRLFTDIFTTDDSQVGVKSFLENGPGKATFSGR